MKLMIHVMTQMNIEYIRCFAVKRSTNLADKHERTGPGSDSEPGSMSRSTR